MIQRQLILVVLSFAYPDASFSQSLLTDRYHIREYHTEQFESHLINPPTTQATGPYQVILSINLAPTTNDALAEGEMLL